MSAYDNALFLWHDATGNLLGIRAMQVDDFIICGNNIFQRNVISEFKKFSKLKYIKIEPSNFGDWLLSKQKMGLLKIKIYMLHLYPQQT